MTLLHEFCRYFRRSHSFLEADSTSLPNRENFSTSHISRFRVAKYFEMRKKIIVFYFNSFCQETSVDF